MIASDQELVHSEADGGTAADKQREYEELARKIGVTERPSPTDVIITGCITLLFLIGAWVSAAQLSAPSPGNEMGQIGWLLPLFGCLLVGIILAVVWLALLGIWSIRRLEWANRKRKLNEMLATDADFAAFYEKWSGGK